MSLRDKAKTGKEWAFFFYEELGYPIVDSEEHEACLKGAMDKVLEDVDGEVQKRDEVIGAYSRSIGQLQTTYLAACEMLKQIRELVKNLKDFTVRYGGSQSLTVYKDELLPKIEELEKVLEQKKP